jgi:1,4-alpha-glucan branching enzyme
VAVAVLVDACGGGDSVDPSGVGEAALGEADVRASGRPGMGAIVYDGGTTFRVWAPFAERVWVTGDFNGWGWTPLASEHNGNFSADVRGAQKHQKYQYVIRNRWGHDERKTDPRAARVDHSNGAGIIHDPGSYDWRARWYETPSRRDQVVYELHVGTFHDGPGFGPGNWQSAAAKLDYLRDLGVNMIEIMPVFEFPGDFSWGYNPSHPFAPETSYGTPDDMKYFVDEAHMRGIGVIFDVVHNHYGPADLSMWCFSGDCLGVGGEYFFADHRAQTPWGRTRPDYGRHEVKEYIKDHSMMLLHEYRADGLRFDATKFIRTIHGDEGSTIAAGWDLLRYVTDAKNREQPYKTLIAEDFGGGEAITKATAWGGAGFDSQWAGEFVHPIRSALIAQNDQDRNMWSVRDAITHGFGGATTRVIYTESHDEVANGKKRLPDEIWPGNAGSWASKKRSTLGAGIVLTSPGIPLLFQGQEFLEDGWFSAEDPIDWSKAGRFRGITQLYRDLIHLRRNWHNNTRGLRGDHVNVFHLNDVDKVVAYHRWDEGGPGDDVVVIANFSARWFPSYAVGLPRGGLWYVRFNSDASAYSSDFGNTQTLDTWARDGGRDGMPVQGSLGLGPYSMVILSQ